MHIQVTCKTVDHKEKWSETNESKRVIFSKLEVLLPDNLHAKKRNPV